MKKKVLASLGLAMAMVATAMPAMAATDVAGGHEVSTHYDEKVTTAEVCAEQTIDADETAECTVYAAVGSTFKVTIPKALTLSGTDKNGAYEVKVEGDIAGNEFVSVTPATSFAMQQTNKADVTASVVQATTLFRGDNYVLAEGASFRDGEVLMATGATGNIYADGTNNSGELSAGAWEGTFNFVIALNEDATN